MSIRLDDVALRAGTFARDALSLDVPGGTYAVLMGRTGCGKTTLLETICGLRPLARGTGDASHDGCRTREQPSMPPTPLGDVKPGARSPTTIGPAWSRESQFGVA